MDCVSIECLARRLTEIRDKYKSYKETRRKKKETNKQNQNENCELSIIGSIRKKKINKENESESYEMNIIGPLVAPGRTDPRQIYQQKRLKLMQKGYSRNEFLDVVDWTKHKNLFLLSKKTKIEMDSAIKILERKTSSTNADPWMRISQEFMKLGSTLMKLDYMMQFYAEWKAIYMLKLLADFPDTTTEELKSKLGCFAYVPFKWPSEVFEVHSLRKILIEKHVKVMNTMSDTAFWKFSHSIKRAYMTFENNQRRNLECVYPLDYYAYYSQLAKTKYLTMQWVHENSDEEIITMKRFLGSLIHIQSKYVRPGEELAHYERILMDENDNLVLDKKRQGRHYYQWLLIKDFVPCETFPETLNTFYNSSMSKYFRSKRDVCSTMARAKYTKIVELSTIHHDADIVSELLGKWHCIRFTHVLAKALKRRGTLRATWALEIDRRHDFMSRQEYLLYMMTIDEAAADKAMTLQKIEERQALINRMRADDKPKVDDYNSNNNENEDPDLDADADDGKNIEKGDNNENKDKCDAGSSAAQVDNFDTNSAAQNRRQELQPRLRPTQSAATTQGDKRNPTTLRQVSVPSLFSNVKKYKYPENTKKDLKGKSKVKFYTPPPPPTTVKSQRLSTKHPWNGPPKTPAAPRYLIGSSCQSSELGIELDDRLSNNNLSRSSSQLSSSIPDSPPIEIMFNGYKPPWSVNTQDEPESSTRQRYAYGHNKKPCWRYLEDYVDDPNIKRRENNRVTDYQLDNIAVIAKPGRRGTGPWDMFYRHTPIVSQAHEKDIPTLSLEPSEQELRAKRKAAERRAERKGKRGRQSTQALGIVDKSANDKSVKEEPVKEDELGDDDDDYDDPGYNHSSSDSISDGPLH